MKNALKFFGIIALVAVIGFSFAACSKKDGGSASGGAVKPSPVKDFETREVDGREVGASEGKGIQIVKYLGNKLEVNIPQKIQNLPVISIGEYAFQNKSLIKVTIPNSVINIGVDAFAKNQLTSVTIPDSVSWIEQEAFLDNQLTSVTIPNSVIGIGDRAFLGNKLTSVTIGANVGLGGNFIAFGKEFYYVYHSGNGEAAGTYTRPNADSTTWTKQ